MRSRVSVSIAAALTGVCASLGSAVAASAAPSHHLTDPVVSGCTADASPVATFPLQDGRNDVYITDLQVMYSRSCHTNWVRVRNPYPDGAVRVNMAISVDGAREFGMGSTSATGYQWSQQVYAPGRTCVSVTATMSQDGRVVAGGGSPIRLC